MSLATDLFVAARFAAAIRRIANRRATSPSITKLQDGGVSLATIDRDRERVADLLVRDLLAGRLVERPGRMFAVQQHGKSRRLCELPLVEMIVHDAVAEWLGERSRESLSPSLYSYRKGMSYRVALRDFARYVRRSPRSQFDVRGLFVLRRDVRSYFDTIPVREDAPVWAELDRLAVMDAHGTAAKQVLRRVLRPVLQNGDGVAYRLACGVPTGSPIANVVANLYLRILDEELSKSPGAFYARYGDDIIVAHPDLQVVDSMDRALNSHLNRQEVQTNARKMGNYYLTMAGRMPPHSAAFRGATAVEFLGHQVTATGTVTLSRQKTRALLRAVRTRAANAAAVESSTFEGRVLRIVHSINAVIAPRSASAHPYAALLRTTVTDRAHLVWLDRELALITIEAALGQRRVAHFRRLPPRRLRAEFGLHSLVASRNGD